MSETEAAAREQEDWPARGIRQRLGSRIERHVLRSAVDILDERGTDLDAIERDLVEREQDLLERIAFADTEEARLERREQRLAEVGATDGDPMEKVDLLVRQLDRTEAVARQLRTDAEAKVATAEQRARELQERVKRLEEAEHRRLLSAAEITRRESALGTRERELREQDERLRRRDHELAAKQQGMLAQERRLDERQRRIDASEQETRKRLESLAARERDLGQREAAFDGREQRWWGFGRTSNR